MAVVVDVQWPVEEFHQVERQNPDVLHVVNNVVVSIVIAQRISKPRLGK